MGIIKIGALQPAAIPVPSEYRWGHDGYKPDFDAIMEKCVLPQAQVTFDLLEQAGKRGLDMVTTCEDLSISSAYIMDTTSANIFPQVVRTVLPILEERLSGIAKKYSMHIVACYFKCYGRDIYNIASVFDDRGEIIGEYRKAHLPSNERFQTTPGDSIHTISTQFGPIGIMICYDMMFPSMAEALSLQGAEIVFHPTFGYGWYDSIGEATLRTRANDGSFFLITAKDYRYNIAGKSSIIDPWGHVMVDAGFTPNVVISAEIDLSKPKMHPDWFIHTGITGQANLRLRHESERRPELYGDVCNKAKYELKIPAPGAEQEAFLEKYIKGVYRW